MTKLPSGIGTIWKAVRRPIRSFDPSRDIDDIKIDIPRLGIELSHVSSFSTVFIADLEDNKPPTSVPPIYPMTFVYPIMLRAVSMSSIPIPMMLSMVSIKNKICFYQTIRPDCTYSVQAGFTEVRSTLKGIELDFAVKLKTSNKTIWQSTNTLFFKKKKLSNQSYKGGFVLTAIENPYNDFSIVINRNLSRHFCRLMGDSNAIHTNRVFARFMGYKNAFSQPYQALGHLLLRKDWLSLLSSHGMFYFEFKGPLYYNDKVTVKYRDEDGKLRFDLYSGENSKPGILGVFEKIDTTV